MYFRHRPTPAMLLSDPDCATHRAFGVPRIDFLPEDSSEPREWPYRADLPGFMAARVNPTGELDEPLQPIETNAVLNAKQGFEMEPADQAILAAHMAQLGGHFLVDAEGKVALDADRGARRAERHRHLSDAGRADRRRGAPRPLIAVLSRGTAARPANRGRLRPSRRPRRRE